MLCGTPLCACGITRMHTCGILGADSAGRTGTHVSRGLLRRARCHLHLMKVISLGVTWSPERAVLCERVSVSSVSVWDMCVHTYHVRVGLVFVKPYHVWCRDGRSSRTHSARCSVCCSVAGADRIYVLHDLDRTASGRRRVRETSYGPPDGIPRHPGNAKRQTDRTNYDTHTIDRTI